MYLRTYLGLLPILLASTLLVNLLLDPLWYGRGNRLEAKNFPFDERLSKTIWLSKTKAKGYDCLIFGSSRATLLRESLFADSTCFNYAFSAGTADEFLKYARYAKAQGLRPKTIYLGIDASNFKQSVSTADTSSIVLTPMYKAYLSFDLLQFSLRYILGQDMGPRYYNSQHEFESEVVKDLPPYQPEFDVRKSDQLCDAEKVDVYREIADEFPEAKVVGFVSPVSSWYMVNFFYHYGNVLDCYFDAVYQLSQEFESVYDFSIPSDITANPANSYNTDHYYPKIQDQVAIAIQGDVLAFGIDVDNYSEEEYRSMYLTAIEGFLSDADREDLIRKDL